MDPLRSSSGKGDLPRIVECSYGEHSLHLNFLEHGFFLTLHDSQTRSLLEKVPLKDRNLELLKPEEAAEKILTLGLHNCTVVLRQSSTYQLEAYLLPVLQGGMDKEPILRRESLLNRKEREFSLPSQRSFSQEELPLSAEERALSYEGRRGGSPLVKARSSFSHILQDGVRSPSSPRHSLAGRASMISYGSPRSSQVFTFPPNYAGMEDFAYLQSLAAMEKRRSTFSTPRSSLAAPFTPRRKRSSLTTERAPPPPIEYNDLIQKKLQNPQLELPLEESITLLTQCIYYGKMEAQKALEKDAVIFIGNTGAGKSTTVNYLCGCTMQLKSPKELGMKGIGKMIVVKPPEEGGALKEVMPIGHTKESHTFMPQIETHNLTYCDCPGFLDNRGAEINIANAVNIKHAIAQAKSATVIMLINYFSLKADRARGLTEMLKISCNLFGKAENLIKHKESILIGISNAPLDMDLTELKEWIAQDTHSLMQTLAERIFIFDPLERPLEGGWKREEFLSQIQQLQPITDHARIFTTVLTDEDEKKLIQISEQIGQRIQEALKLKDFRQAASHYHRLEELRIIDHVSIERLLMLNQQKIQRYLQDEANEFRIHCQFERFEQAEEILNQLQEALGYFDEEIEESIRLPSLYTHYQDSKDKALEAKRKEEELQWRLFEAQQQIQLFLTLLDEQKQQAEEQILIQQQSFAKAMHEMENTMKRTSVEYSALSLALRDEIEERLAKKEEELQVVQDLTLQETEQKIEQERTRLNTEYAQKRQEMEKERARVIQEQQALKQKAEQELEQEQARLRQKIQEIEKTKQEKLAEQQRLVSPEMYPLQATSLPRMAFGKKDWEKYFGFIGEEPPLPANIREILKSPYLVRHESMFKKKKEKTIEETHVLALVPQTVDGKPLTLNSLRKLISHPKGEGHKTAYKFYDKGVKTTHGKKPAPPSHWILLTKDVIPGTRGKFYEKQCEKLGKHASEDGVAYEPPKALDVAVGILTEYVRSGVRLYNDNPWTYTRCQETLGEEEWRITIGGFDSSGLTIRSEMWDNQTDGLAGLRKCLDT